MLYAKIHKNKAENLLHLMLYFSNIAFWLDLCCNFVRIVIDIKCECVCFQGRQAKPDTLQQLKEDGT